MTGPSGYPPPGLPKGPPNMADNTLVAQGTKRPTNKLTAATAAATVVQLATGAYEWVTGDSLPVELYGPVTVLATFLAGYFVKDRANT
jgi:hypothetical protein